jgi:hypothetical protein
MCKSLFYSFFIIMIGQKPIDLYLVEGEKGLCEEHVDFRKG